jgi:hypothetical protein
VEAGAAAGVVPKDPNIFVAGLAAVEAIVSYRLERDIQKRLF